MRHALYIYRLTAGILALLGISPLAVEAQTKLLEPQPQALALLEQSMRAETAEIGLHITRISDGAVLYDLNSHQALTPASIVKVLSTGAALRQHGGQYRYPTEVYMVGRQYGDSLAGGLLIIGHGDPSLGSSLVYDQRTRLADEIASALQRRGIRKVSGGLHLDASRLQGLGVHPSWEDEDIVEPYGAGIFGLNYEDNTLGIALKGPRKRGVRAQLDPTYEPTGIDYDVQTKTAKHTKVKVRLTPTQPRVELSGTLSVGHQGYGLRIANPDPATTLGNTLTRQLSDRGIGLGRAPRRSYAGYEVEGNLLHTYLSPHLDTLCLITNYRSQNLYAEAIASTLSDTLSRGVALSRYWHQHLPGLSSEELSLSDGSGLSRQNRLSARAMSMALVYLFGGNEPHDGALMDTLPQVGQDGTVRHLMPSHRLTAYLKSGSMKQVVCYAGYIHYEGEWYTLAFLSNGYRSGRTARQALTEFLMEAFPDTSLKGEITLTIEDDE